VLPVFGTDKGPKAPQMMIVVPSKVVRGKPGKSSW